MVRISQRVRRFFRNKTRMERSFSSESPGSITVLVLFDARFVCRASLSRIIVSHAFVSFSSEMGSEINSHALFRNKASNKNASEPWMFNNLLKTRKFGSGSSYAFK